MLIFILGLLIGSFLNVCIYRLPKGQSIAFPPSHCTGCSNRIKPYDLIPVISYIILKGKCRHCNTSISIKYPLVEILTGVLFLFSFLKFGYSIEFIKSIVLLSVLVAVTFIDFEYSIIQVEFMIFASLTGIVLNIIGYEFNIHLLNYLYGFLVGGGVILAIVLLTNGMGGGDIQLMTVIGLFLGFKLTLLTLMLSFVIGAFAGVTLIVLKKKSRKDFIPFGPWISIAAFVSLFFGDSILRWYFSLF